MLAGLAVKSHILHINITVNLAFTVQASYVQRLSYTAVRD